MKKTAGHPLRLTLETLRDLTLTQTSVVVGGRGGPTRIPPTRQPDMPAPCPAPEPAPRSPWDDWPPTIPTWTQTIK